MANRSDFFKSTPTKPKLPRYLKKALSLQNAGPEIRRMFVGAHLAHIAFKQKRDDKEAVDTTEVE